MFAMFGTAKLVMAAIAAAVLLGGFLWIKGVLAERDAAEARAQTLAVQINEAERINRENVLAAERIQVATDRKLAAVTRERDAFADRTAKLNRFFDEVRNAPDSDDGPVAPVMQRALERMWGGREASGPADKGKGRAGRNP